MKRGLLNAHPFLFTLVSMLFFYFGAKLIVHPADVVRPAIILCGVALITFLFFRRVIGDLYWAGILTTVFVFSFYFSRSSFMSLGGIVLLEVCLLLVALKILKRHFDVQYVSALLSITAFIIVISQLVVVYLLLRSVPSSYYAAMRSRENDLAVSLQTPSDGVLPDIYYIVLDGYPRADALLDYFGFDNTRFIQQLEDRGFVVPELSLSNYPRTALSVSSTLDMQYWDSIASDLQGVRFWWLAEPVFDHSRLRVSLEAIGYQSMAIGVDWGLTDNPTTDLYFSPYPYALTDFENYMISGSPLKVLYPFQGIAPLASYNTHREYVLYNLQRLSDAPGIPDPKFVFSHIIIPHPPFVFDADGAPIDTSSGFTFDSPTSVDIPESEYRRLYVDQVKFINKRIIEVIDSILQTSSVPPIIVLQADHGSAMHVDFMDVDNSCLRERYSVFAAYHLPGSGENIIPQDVTPVNIFRIVLNEYFNANMDLLENRQYFTMGTNLFELQEVTDKVSRVCVIAP